MAALQELFASPLGLLALAAVVPLVLLYLVRPDPQRIRLPTLEFLTAGDDTASDRPALSRLRRNLLLLLQVLVVAAVALALASPYVTVAQETTVAETVVVVDTSASMTVAADGTSRFDRAVAEARGAVTETTSVVTAGGRPRVVLRGGGPPDAEAVLDELRATDVPGDLAGAISRAVAVAGQEARIVVASDFAGPGRWRDVVETARARGYTVELRPVGDRVDNVGIVAAEYGRSSVTLTVQNFGETPASRRVEYAGEGESFDLGPGDVATATFPVPAGDSRVRLVPRDAFPTDDTLYVAGPSDETIDVLLVTNDPNRNLVTAFEVLDEVDLTVANPPTTVDREYDVVVFSNVAPDRLLRSTVEEAGDVASSGGGVVIQAQSDLDRVAYRDLLPVAVGPNASNPSMQVRPDPLTRDITFPPPNDYLTGNLTRGEAVVTADGDPFIARANLGAGRLLYYGYLPGSSFRYTYQYPVFWKRVLYEAVGREPLAATNRGTGGVLDVPNGTTVRGPDGETTGPTALDSVGQYRVGEDRLGVSLLSREESNVSAPPLAGGEGGPVRERSETREVPKDLSYLAALAGVLFVLGEVGLLRYRGDL